MGEPIAYIVLDKDGRPATTPVLPLLKDGFSAEGWDLLYPHRAPHRVSALVEDTYRMELPRGNQGERP